MNGIDSSSPVSAPENAPKARVIAAIVAMGSAGLVADCLAAILAGGHLPEAVIVVENGGAAAFDALAAGLRARALVEGAPRPHQDTNGRHLVWRHETGVAIVLIDPGANLGYAGGNNVALRQTLFPDWDAAWILNPDTIPERGSLAALVARQAEGGFGMVGSRLVFTASGRVQTWGGLGWNLWLGRGKYLGYLHGPAERPDIADVERRIVFVSGASMYVTRAYIDAVGMMDDAFFMYCEDLDWCLRGAHLGFGYAHDSVVNHIHGGSSGASHVKAERSAFSIYFAERNKVHIARRHMGRAAPLVIAIGFLSLAEYLVRARSWRQFRVALAGWWAGVRGETGPRKV